MKGFKHELCRHLRWAFLMCGTELILAKQVFRLHYLLNNLSTKDVKFRKVLISS